MKSALYAVLAAFLFLAAIAVVDWSSHRFDYPAPAITYQETQQ